MREMRYGLSGYLAPDGIFYECDYGKHSELANELIEKYKIKNKTNYNEIATRGEFLKFGTYPWSSKEGCSGCHVFKSLFHPLSNKQSIWIKENLDKLTDKQRSELNRLLDQEELIRNKLAMESKKDVEKIQISYRVGTRLSAVGV
ncbi:hypothetical protein COL82_04060 [Bacillus toyonensis]|uniref:hypothetical protein n=1 Tax=Bacillus toyonensis TaxID=155322 RepID=UPI000BF2780E|nr:hypothetical protein [Bacillus toyonensis]PFZ80076.1 hypothetical protein COL82_04060 [Bacillus toyonensis]